MKQIYHGKGRKRRREDYNKFVLAMMQRIPRDGTTTLYTDTKHNAEGKNRYEFKFIGDEPYFGVYNEDAALCTKSWGSVAELMERNNYFYIMKFTCILDEILAVE